MKKGTWQRIVVVVVFAALIAGLWTIAAGLLPLERIASSESTMRDWISQHPWTAFGLGFVVYTLVSLFPGTSGKSVICGWLYGFWQAMLIVTVALTIAAVLSFWIARYVLSDALRERLGERLAAIDRGLERDGAYYLLTLRMLHTPYSLVNYSAGISRISPWTFAWTTWLGLVPGTIAFVGVGTGLPTLDELIEKGPLGLLSPTLLVALALMGALPLLVRAVVRRVRPSHQEVGA